MENSKKVIDRAKALEFLWDTDDKSISNSSISVYISRLREKLSLIQLAQNILLLLEGLVIGGIKRLEELKCLG